MPRLILTLANNEKHQLTDGSSKKFDKVLIEYWQNNYKSSINIDYHLSELPENSLAHKKNIYDQELLIKAKKLLDESAVVARIKKDYSAKLIEGSIKITEL